MVGFARPTKYKRAEPLNTHHHLTAHLRGSSFDYKQAAPPLLDHSPLYFVHRAISAAPLGKSLVLILTVSAYAPCWRHSVQSMMCICFCDRCFSGPGHLPPVL